MEPTRSRSGGLVTRQVLQPLLAFQIYVIHVALDEKSPWTIIAQSEKESKAKLIEHIGCDVSEYISEIEQIGTALFGPSRVVC